MEIILNNEVAIVECYSDYYVFGIIQRSEYQATHSVIYRAKSKEECQMWCDISGFKTICRNDLCQKFVKFRLRQMGDKVVKIIKSSLLNRYYVIPGPIYHIIHESDSIEECKIWCDMMSIKFVVI